MARVVSTAGSGRLRLLVAAAVLLAFVLVLGAAPATAAAPVVTVEDAANVTATTAEVEGEVQPEGASTNWRFQYITDAAYQTNLGNSQPGFENASQGPSGSTETAEAVGGELMSLLPNTTYHLRLFADSGEGSAEDVAANFKTAAAAPDVIPFGADPIHPTSAEINGEVSPRGSATVYWFEWGPEDCSANPCQSLPTSHDASAGAGQEHVYVSRQLEGLSPETTYHYRLIAQNASGTVAGADRQFTTPAPETCSNAGAPGTALLPNCRAFEMVSPPEKNGGDVLPMSSHTRTAADGNAVAFGSLVPFGDQPGAIYEQDYLAERTAVPGTNGWTTHGITPAQPALGPGEQLTGPRGTYAWDMSPDLTHGFYLSADQLFGDESSNAADKPNLYVRDDLRTPGAGSYRLVTEPFTPIPGSLDLPSMIPAAVGASADYSKVLISSGLPLTADAEENSQPKIFENDDGVLRLAARIPSSGDECDNLSGPSCVPTATSSTSRANMVSADGSRVFFGVPGAATGGVFARIDGTRTVKLNASERSTPEAPREATLWDASVDGSRVFFTTFESLVEGDASGVDIYMYDFTKPQGQRLTLVTVDGEPADFQNDSPSVVGASDDGRYLYFQLYGQLVAGEQNGGASIYVWHEGRVSLIGRFVKQSDQDYNRLDGGSFAFSGLVPPARVTPDGRHLVFRANVFSGFEGHGGFQGYDKCPPGPAGCGQLLLYDAESGRLRCATCNPVETPTSVPNSFGSLEDEVSNSGRPGTLDRALSADGRFVFFNTEEALVPEDTNGKYDAYEYDSRDEEFQLVSSGTDSKGAVFLNASLSGRDVFIATREPLSGWDQDSNRDLYDARIDGGLPEPPPVAAPCQGESCRPAAGAAPAAPSIGSSHAGPGNANPPRRCPKGRHAKKVRGKTRCVKPRHGKHRRGHGRSGSNGRASR